MRLKDIASMLAVGIGVKFSIGINLVHIIF